MKYEWKKEEKGLYVPKDKAELVTVPQFKCFIIKGEGDPESEDFLQRADVLNRLSNSIKTMPKRGFIPGGYYEYSVYPLEAVWEFKSGGVYGGRYTLMVRQPSFVTEAIARMTVTNIISTNPHPLASEVQYTTMGGGTAVQIMHTGCGGKEESFDVLRQFAKLNGIKIKEDIFHEIYISNAKRTAPQKLKTVLRLMVEN